MAVSSASDTPLPRHVAIVMDGNGRWASKRFMPRGVGHKAGVDSLVNVVKACNERNIQYVSFEDWHFLDTVEQERGEYRNAPRLKFSKVDEMLKAIKERKNVTQEMQAAAAATPPPLAAD